jgi:hypothetical protein
MKIHGFKGVVQVIKTSFIDGKLKYYIVDGQHRVAAATQLGLPIRFELTELNDRQSTAEFIAELNTSAKSWGTTNFLNVWASLDIAEYLTLDAVMKETGFQITPLLEAYLFTSNQIEFRRGKMKFPNEKQSKKIITQMIELNQFLPSKSFCRRAVVKVMRNDLYNHKKMMSAVKDYIRLVGSFTENERGLKRELETLMLNY